MRYELSDAEWRILRGMLPHKSRGVARVDDRRVLNGIFWVLRSGAPWRDLPQIYGPRTTCYNRFIRWQRAGIWRSIMKALATVHDAKVEMIDTSMVRVHQHAACISDGASQSVGRSRGGLTSKLHALVDANGLPIRLGLTPGEVHDNRLCSVLLSGLKPHTMLLADRAYDADWIRALINGQGAWANIPPKRNRKDPICFSPYLYRARNLVERFFNKIKHCRRIATRYDKLAANYLAFVELASIRLWLRVYEFTTLGKGIRTYTQQVNDEALVKTMRLALEQAERVAFLGFGFHSQNMDLIAPRKRSQPKHIFASALGFSKTDSDDLVRSLAEMFQGTSHDRIHVERGLTCAGLFDEFRRSLVS